MKKNALILLISFPFLIYSCKKEEMHVASKSKSTLNNHFEEDSTTLELGTVFSAPGYDYGVGMVRTMKGDFYFPSGRKILKISNGRLSEFYHPPSDFYPIDLALDKNENLYCAGNLSNERLGRVISIDHTGKSKVITTTDTPLRQIAISNSGDIYVTAGWERILKYCDGKMVDFAGRETNEFIYKDGKGVNARFTGIEDMSIDGKGNIYAVDYSYSDSRIRKITKSGIVSTVETSPQVIPFTVDAADDGTLFVSSFEDIKRLSPDGKVSTLTKKRANDNFNFLDVALSQDSIYTMFRDSRTASEWGIKRLYHANQ